MTAHLGGLGPVSVRVVRETLAAAWPDERACLRGAARVWTREVLLSVDGVPCVAAHSVTPATHSHGVWKAMRGLRTRPLADLLYHDRAVRRSPLVSRRLAARRRFPAVDPLAGLPYGADEPGVSSLSGLSGGSTPGESAPPAGTSPRRHPVVARRSLFERRGAPLLITECFLPALWHLLENRRRGTPR